jgi:D-alanine-D-alanine ligase
VTESATDRAPQVPRKIRIGIVFGGRSGEHEVSLTSAQGIMKAIDGNKYDVVPIGITKEGRWITLSDATRLLETGEAAGSDQELAGSLGLCRVAQADSGEMGAVKLDSQTLDVIFPILHGPYGEDGTVQGFLDLLGVPYVGAGVMASAVCMDKAISKQIFLAHDLPILPYRVFLRRVWENQPDQVVAECEAALDYPMFTKPANMGSSVGINKVHCREDLFAGLTEATLYDRKMIVEQGIEAREIEVSVLGNDDPIASVPGEIIPSRSFYSYAAKYLDDASDLLIPAPISAEQTVRVRQLAIQAYTAVDCAGMARVDFLMDKATDKIWLNELNTIPGFTPISMYPKLWEASGIGYTELIDRLIQLAIERREDEGRSVTPFDVSKAT